jgi:hypothetical protein
MHQSYPDSLPFSSAQAFFAQFECAPLSSIIRRGVGGLTMQRASSVPRPRPNSTCHGEHVVGTHGDVAVKRRDISIMCSKQGEKREHSFLSLAVMRKCGCSVGFWWDSSGVSPMNGLRIDFVMSLMRNTTIIPQLRSHGNN